jgi:hypothetical protein
MGIIAKQVRKRANQRLAEPLTTATRMSAKQVGEAVVGVCKQHNEAAIADLERRRQQGGRLKRMAAKGTDGSRLQYHVVTRESDILVSFERSPQFILANPKRRAGVTDGYWLAVVRVLAGAGPQSPERTVEVRLSKWLMDNNSGKLENQAKYEEFTDMLWNAVTVQDHQLSLE